MSTIITLAKHTFKEVIRKKDFYVFLILLVGLVLFFYQESFFNVTGVSRYLKDIGYTLVVLFAAIVSITFSAKQIPSELESKTIYPLLAKPVSRTQLVLGKFTGSMFISGFTFTVFFIVYLIAVIFKGEKANLILIFQTYIFSILLLAMLSSIAMIFSLFLTLSANVTITLLVYFLIAWYNSIIKGIITSTQGLASILYSFVYYILPHFEFYDIKIRMVHMWDPVPLGIFMAVLIYTLIYTAIILNLTCFLFNRKNL